MRDDELAQLRQLEDEAAEQINAAAAQVTRAVASYECIRQERLRREATAAPTTQPKKRHLRSLTIPGLVGAGAAVAHDIIENAGSAAVAVGAIVTVGVVTAAALTHIPDRHPARRAVPPPSAPSPARPPTQRAPSIVKPSPPPMAERVRAPASRRHTATATPEDGTFRPLHPLRPLRPVKAVRTVRVQPTKAPPNPSSVPASPPKVARLIDLRHPIDIRKDLRWPSR